MSDVQLLTLKIDDQEFPVDRCKAIEKSRYFHSLYTHDFSDSKESVHTVNYKVSPSVVQDFCNWIDEDYSRSGDNVEAFRIKMSLQKYLSDNFKYLKQLLRFSVIYGVDDLSLELSDIVVSHWLKPDLILELWKISQELGLTILRDVVFATCLERFVEIPVGGLIDIPVEDFVALLANVNLASSIKSHLDRVIKRRLTREDEEGQETRSKLLELYEVNSRCTGRRSKLISCFFAETLRLSEDCCRVVYAFDGHLPSRFWELVELWKMKERKVDLAGMAVVGRGFSIYKMGGELRIGSCKFNMNIWRYCLLSKKWYYVARLRKARRHMAVALVDNKLILIGGVGRYRLKMSSVETFDLHTGSWITCENVPETFTDFPPVCTIEGMVAVCVSSIYFFNPSSNRWITVTHSFECQETAGVKCLASYKNILYLGKEGGLFLGYKVMWDGNFVDGDVSGIQGCTLVRLENEQFKSECERIMIQDDGRVFGLLYEFEKIIVECGDLTSCKSSYNSKLCDFSLPLNSISPISCFNVIDPSTLYSNIE